MPDKDEHTPGPWEVGITPSDDRRIALVLKGTDMRESGAVYSDVHATRDQIKKQEPAANARLIAAAPDLLAACEKMVQAVPPDGEALRASHSAERAIAKARGLPDPSDSDLPDRDERGVVGLTGAGEEVDELRDENERLKERVAELEKTKVEAQERIGELEGALLRVRDWIEEKGYRGEGEQTVFDEHWDPEAHLDLHSMLVKDARAVFASLSSDENASREAEVGQ